MRCSVVLCTYNGSAFIADQLDSYRSQTSRPDEVIVCDDASSDDTVARVEAFARTVSFPVRIHVNPHNLGLDRNFAKSIELARGDLILPSDQDDVWRLDKIRTMRDVFAEAPEVGIVVSDAAVVDEGMHPLGFTLWQNFGLSARIQRALDSGDGFATLLKTNTLAGATMAFRADLRRYLLPFPPGWIYDSWLGLVLTAYAQCRLIREPMNLWRQHTNQAVGAFGMATRVKAATAMTRQTYADNAQAFKYLRERMIQFQSDLLDKKFLTLIDEKIEFFQARSRLNSARILRIPAVLAQLARGRYHRYASGWKSVAKDCLTP